MMANSVTKIHGILSLLFVFACIVLGFVAIFPYSLIVALLYAGIAVIGLLAIVYSFCTLCPCHDSCCAHVIPGLLAQLMPKREKATYSKVDYIIIIVSFAFLFGFPQYWLWQHWVFGVVFWILLLVAILEIRRTLCSTCKNTLCPGNAT